MKEFIFEYIQYHSYDYNDAFDFEIEEFQIKGDEIKVIFSYQTEYSTGTYRPTATEYIPLVEMLKDIYSKL